MPTQRRLLKEGGQRCILFRDGHFVEQPMDTIVAGPANVDALGQGAFIEGSLEVTTSVQLFRNEVMES